MTRFVEVFDASSRSCWINLDLVASARESSPENARPVILLTTTDGDRFSIGCHDWEVTLRSTLSIVPASPGFSILQWSADRESPPNDAPEQYPVIAWDLSRIPPRPITFSEDAPRDQSTAADFWIFAIRSPDGSAYFQDEGSFSDRKRHPGNRHRPLPSLAPARHR